MKCRYCDGVAVRILTWLKDKHQRPARIDLPWCGCDLNEAMKRFWLRPYMVREGVDYEVREFKLEKMVGGFPRRCRLDWLTPGELAIRNAVVAVEKVGAHPLLTDAVNLLQAAQEKVADFVELGL